MSPHNLTVRVSNKNVLANNPSGATVCANRKVTYRDFTDVSNSIANLALTLPDEDARVECLGMLVQMRHSLSISAAGGHQASVPLSQFMLSAEEFLHAFGPNAKSRREGVFLADHSNGSFEMQRHHIGMVQQKQLTPQNERNACGTKRRQPSVVLNEMAQNLHLADARSRQATTMFILRFL